MIAISTLLTLAVIAIWIGCIGFIRLGAPFDRLHCVTFVAASAGPLTAAVSFVADGASDRSWKILLLIVLLLGNGAAISHATARMIAWRDLSGERA
jgi:multisubunit Na+/H+ antiporter MnhG subunit